MGETEAPHNVRLVIERRLAGIHADTRRVLAAGAIIGKAFGFDLLKQADQAGERKLLAALEEAELSNLIFSNDSDTETEFEFVHELIRQMVLSTLSVARRQRLHLTVADAIERIYPEAIEEHAADLAHHLWQARARADTSRVLRWISNSADQARRRGAYIEARRLLQNALALVPKLPATRQRDDLELELLGSMVRVANFVTGYATEEVLEFNARAKKLAEKTGNLRQLLEQTWSTWASSFCSAEYSAAQALANQMLDLAQSEGSAFSLALAYDAQVEVAQRRGELLRCEEYFSRGEKFFDSPEFIAFVEASVSLLVQRP